MSPKSKPQENASKPSFSKSLSPGEDWKSKSMRMIPEEFVRSTPGAFEHRVVLSVRWGNSWQLWLERDKNGLFMVEEDWDEFVDDNLLGPNDILLFKHEDTLFLQVQIFGKDKKEIISPPVKPQNSHQEAFGSAYANGRGRQSCALVENPERYLLNPKNPYFVKTLTKKNDVLYVRRPAIQKYGLEFGPANSTIHYIIPEGKVDAFLRFYGGTPCFSGWPSVCRRYNLKLGDIVVCELERSGGLVTAVRVHVVNE